MQEKYTILVHMITVAYFNTSHGVLLRSTKMVCILQEKIVTGSGMLGYVKIKKRVLYHTKVIPFYKSQLFSIRIYYSMHALIYIV